MQGQFAEHVTRSKSYRLETRRVVGSAPEYTASSTKLPLALDCSGLPGVLWTLPCSDLSWSLNGSQPGVNGSANSYSGHSISHPFVAPFSPFNYEISGNGASHLETYTSGYKWQCTHRQAGQPRLLHVARARTPLPKLCLPGFQVSIGSLAGTSIR